MADDKYIRTFGGDVEAVQKGDTPDLVPLHHAEALKDALRNPIPVPAPSERLVEASSLPSVQVPAPAQIPEPAPVAVPIEQSQVPLKTYASDFSRLMKETQASAVTVLAAEQDEAPRAPQILPTAEKFSLTNLIYGIAGGVLLIAGMVGAYFAYISYLGTAASVVVAPTISAPIFVDEHSQVSGSGDTLSQAIAQSVASPIKQGAIRLLSLDTGASVFPALQLPAPGALTRNINAAQSMAGVVIVNGKQSPFFILSVASYGDTFAAMLSWEQFMPRDLTKLFPPYPAPVVNTPVATSATATSSTKSAITTPTPAVTSILTAAFYDTTIANHDARAYRDSAGRIILLYGYWDQKTLIIARDAAAFTEIVRRLATSRTP